MSAPTFTSLDVGLPGGSLNPASARSLVSVQVGNLEVVRVSFAFPGFPGQFSHVHGPRKRRLTWRLTIRAASTSVLNTIEQSVEDAMLDGAGTLQDSKGRSYSRTIVTSYRPGAGYDTIRGGDMDGWVRREDTIDFEVQSGE